MQKTKKFIMDLVLLVFGMTLILFFVGVWLLVQTINAWRKINRMVNNKYTRQQIVWP